MIGDLSLFTREGLPDALRVLLRDYPRDGWERDPNFHGLVSFWLSMHLQFRDGLALMRDDAEAVLDRRMDARDWGGRLSRVGGQFVQHLHQHHGIEDHHYFPILSQRDPRLTRGFAILDTDHTDLHGLIDGFVEGANAALSSLDAPDLRSQAGRVHEMLGRFERFLNRHLTDEEELVVPVLLRDGETGLS